MQYILLFHCNNGYANAPQCYVSTYLACLNIMAVHVVTENENGNARSVKQPVRFLTWFYLRESLVSEFKGQFCCPSFSGGYSLDTGRRKRPCDAVSDNKVVYLLAFHNIVDRLRLKCDGTRPETRFRLSAKRTSPFISAGASVQSTTGSRGVRISGNNAGHTMFRGSVKGTGYPLHSPVSPSLPLPCVTVCHHISAGLYINS